MDKLRAIEVFIAIAEHGSLTEAANRLGKAVPTVVRTLAGLEEHLGVRLFNRSTRRVSLTEEGHLYLAHCSRMADEMAVVEAQLRGAGEEPAGLVHLTAPIFFGERHVMPAVSQLLSSYPHLRIRLLLQDRIVDLVQEHIDIAVRIGHLQDSSLIARPIGHVRQVLCASPGFLERQGEPSHPAELADMPCMQVDGNNAGLTWPFRMGGERLAVPIVGRFICNTMKPTVEACIDGLGYGLFLSYQVADTIKLGTLKILLPDFEPPPLPVQLVYPHARPLSLRVRAVLDDLDAAIAASLRVAHDGLSPEHGETTPTVDAPPRAMAAPDLNDAEPLA